MADMVDTEEGAGKRRFSTTSRDESVVPVSNGSASSTGAGAMLRLIRDGRATTRAELVALTGLARSTVAQRMDALLAQRLVIPAGASASTGGRPPKTFAFNRNAGVVLAADLGATHSRVAVTDLAGDVMVQTRADIAIADGPDTVLGWLEETFDALLTESGHERADVRGIGVGIPGPVEFATGTPVAPPIMPGWDGYGGGGLLRDRYNAPVLVDNDVNIMALGEYWSRWRDTEHLLFVKVGTGIGCGVITNGRIHRGAQGAAGDIGHIHVPDHDDVICRCGNLGCPEAMRLVRQAGRELGGVLASAVNFFNPAVIVIGGDIAHADEHLLAGVREVVYRRSTALATRSIRIARSTLDDRAGILGAAVMVIEAVLAPDAVDQAIAASSA